MGQTWAGLHFMNSIIVICSPIWSHAQYYMLQSVPKKRLWSLFSILCIVKGGSLEVVGKDGKCSNRRWLPEPLYKWVNETGQLDNECTLNCIWFQWRAFILELWRSVHPKRYGPLMWHWWIILLGRIPNQPPCDQKYSQILWIRCSKRKWWMITTHDKLGQEMLTDGKTVAIMTYNHHWLPSSSQSPMLELKGGN